MTVHVLHAGDGYTYLTRQVASGDHQRRHGEALADYYTAAGNPPGRWVGTGRAVTSTRPGPLLGSLGGGYKTTDTCTTKVRRRRSTACGRCPQASGIRSEQARL